jgi:hypothetical protein
VLVAVVALVHFVSLIVAVVVRSVRQWMTALRIALLEPLPLPMLATLAIISIPVAVLDAVAVVLAVSVFAAQLFAVVAIVAEPAIFVAELEGLPFAVAVVAGFVPLLFF